MKSSLSYIVIFVLFAILSTGCTTSPQTTSTPADTGEYITTLDSTDLNAQLSTYPAGILTPGEQQDILFMQEEEKLARDVYTALYEKWKIPVFSNIGDAELTHMDSVTLLVTRYGLDSSMSNEQGVFSNETLQNLYNQLVGEGSASPTRALIVGAFIEEIDIVDLQDAMGRTDKPDILLVYENLAKGSRNHLRAFVKVLAQEGENYQPQRLSQTEFDEIIVSPVERGRN